MVGREPRWELVGTSVTPHVRASSMRFRRDPGPANGAPVRLFIRGGYDAPARADFRFNGETPAELVGSDAWAWSDALGEEAAAEAAIPEGALTVITLNTRAAEWDQGSAFELRAGRRGEAISVSVAPPQVWVSALTFLSRDGGVYPDTLVAHVENHSPRPVRVAEVSLYTAKDRSTWTMLYSHPPFSRLRRYPRRRRIPPGDSGCVVVGTGRLPLTYAVVKVVLRPDGGAPCSAWGHVKTKVDWSPTNEGVPIRDAPAKVAVYVAAAGRTLRAQLEARRDGLVAE